MSGRFEKLEHRGAQPDGVSVTDRSERKRSVAPVTENDFCSGMIGQLDVAAYKIRVEMSFDDISNFEVGFPGSF
jgi:hypothetical protein